MTLEFYGQKHLAAYDALLTTRLRLIEGPLQVGWRHSGMTADFLAETMALRYRSSPTIYRRARHDIGYLTNELIENAIKFRAPGDILVEVSIDADQFRMKLVNFISLDASRHFKRLLEKITSHDPGDLLIEQLERNAASLAGAVSGLGLLTLMNDYQAHLAWVFEESTAEQILNLTTYASMAVGAANNP